MGAAWPSAAAKKARWAAERDAVTRRLEALATGDLPDEWVPHVSTLIDEAPLPLLVAAVEEAARSMDVPPRRVWAHLKRWAAAFRSPRPEWA